MAEAFSTVILSGSTNGRGIKVAATSSPGTTIHDAHATAKDELYLYAYNSDTVVRELTLQLGGTTSPDDDLKITIPPKTGRMCVIDGQRFTGSVSIKAHAAAANVIIITGNCNRITTV